MPCFVDWWVVLDLLRAKAERGDLGVSGLFGRIVWMDDPVAG